MLWLCLHFPRLPLEIHSRAQAGERPWAIGAGQGDRRGDRIVLCNALAHALGIRPGMTLTAAQGLAADLRISPRDPAAEERALASLAARAGRFSSLVSLLAPQALLLEIAASLRLFGGLHALLRLVRDDFDPLGYSAVTGIAPTPLGAALLARAGVATPVTAVSALPSALRDLPVALLDADERQLDALQSMGVHRLGELLRLPHAGLARRFGAELTERIERLLGLRPDPRPCYQPPKRFGQHLALPAETDDSEALLFPAHRLLLELEGFLRRHDAGARRLAWTLIHERLHEPPPPTRLDIGLAAPQRDPRHLLTLLREHLSRVALAHPVAGLALEVDDLETLLPATPAIDGAQQAPAEDWPQLVEKLRARLGEEAVHGLCCFADHRPECAWRACAPGEETDAASAPPPAPHRPLWLLAEPLALQPRGPRALPALAGEAPLALLQGPERIESGWWDGGDAARDYYVARDGACARYWIYRERRGARRWFLHGYFA